MNTKLIFALLTALSAPVAAQGYLTTPPTGTQNEGSDASYEFGWLPDTTHRFMDFSHQGKPSTLRGVSFRIDYRNMNAIGRTWTKVELWIAHGDWSSIQYNQSNTYQLVDTPVKVFDQQWSFPTATGFPPVKPAPWRGLQNSLSFTFSQPWNYNGKDAIFLEFRFVGGKRHDNQPWVVSRGLTEYWLDSMDESEWTGAGVSTSYPPNPTPCFDSAFQRAPARLLVTLRGGNTVDLDVESLFTSPTDPVVHAIGLKGVAQGVNIGGQCNLLYPDVGWTTFLTLPAPNNPTAMAQTRLQTPAFPWLTELWVQVGWLDSVTKNLKLTHAQRVAVGGSSIPAVHSINVFGNHTDWTSERLPFLRYDL